MVWVPLIFSCEMYRRTVLSMEAQFKRASALSRLVSMEVATSRRLNSAACRGVGAHILVGEGEQRRAHGQRGRMVKKRIPTDLPPQRKRWLLFIAEPPFR